MIQHCFNIVGSLVVQSIIEEYTCTTVPEKEIHLSDSLNQKFQKNGTQYRICPKIVVVLSPVTDNCPS